MVLLSHPSLGWLHFFIFSATWTHCIHLHCNDSPPPASFVLNLRYLGEKKYEESMRKCTGWPLHDPRLRLWHWFACLHDKVKTTHPITARLGSYIPLVMLINRFLIILLENIFWHFFKNFWCFFFFFKFKHTIGHCSGMFGPNKGKWKGSALVQ